MQIEMWQFSYDKYTTYHRVNVQGCKYCNYSIYEECTGAVYQMIIHVQKYITMINSRMLYIEGQEYQLKS